MRIARPRRLEPVGVALRIAELERVLAHFRRRQQLVARVEQLREAGVGADPPVMLAARADVEVRLVFAGEQHLAAARALDPQVLGGFALVAERERIADAGEPAHARASLRAEWTASASDAVYSRRCSAAAPPCWPTISTSAEPTTTPSATR